MVKWFTTMSASLLEGVLNGFAISVPRSFPSWQYARMIWLCSSCSWYSSLIIFTVVHQCLDVYDVLSLPGHNILKFPEVDMGVDITCHSLLYSVEEGRSFHLGHSLFLSAASRHPLYMHLQGFGSQGCKDIMEVVLAVRHDVVKEEPVSTGYTKIWRKSGMHLLSPSHRWAGRWMQF